MQAQVGSAADLAVALRQVDPRPVQVAGALADRSLVKTWALRGTLHVLNRWPGRAKVARVGTALGRALTVTVSTF